jgi:hypothetical protein
MWVTIQYGHTMTLVSVSLQRSRLTYVEFVVDKVALGQVFLLILWFPPVNIIPLGLHTPISAG